MSVIIKRLSLIQQTISNWLFRGVRDLCPFPESAPAMVANMYPWPNVFTARFKFYLQWKVITKVWFYTIDSWYVIFWSNLNLINCFIIYKTKTWQVISDLTIFSVLVHLKILFIIDKRMVFPWRLILSVFEKNEYLK